MASEEMFRKFVSRDGEDLFYEIFTRQERDEWIENEVEKEIEEAKRQGEDMDEQDLAMYRLELSCEFVRIADEQG